ncbi:MAG: hypothetical protein ACI4TK_01585 [Agathobacter sp.]
MRKKILIVCGCLLAILAVVAMLSIYDMKSQMKEYYSHYYQGLKIEQKYHTACGACINYISENDYGAVKSVSVREVLFADVKDDIELMEGTYVDVATLWELTFVIDGYLTDELIIYCVPEENNICAVIDSRYIGSTKYQFGYEMSQTTCRRGEKLAIKVTLTNISGEEQHYSGKYSDYNALVKLFFQDKEGIHIMQCMPMSYKEDNTEAGEYVVESMESRSKTYYYMIPDYAPVGEYHLELSYDGDATIYRDVLRVTK